MHSLTDTHAHAHTHTHTHRSFATPLDGQDTTCKAAVACTQARSADAKQRLFEMLIVGRKGGEEEKRSFSTAASIYIMLLFAPPCGGNSAHSNERKYWRFSALKHIVATNGTEYLPLFPFLSVAPPPTRLPLFYLPSSVAHTLHFYLCNEDPS